MIGAEGSAKEIEASDEFLLAQLRWWRNSRHRGPFPFHGVLKAYRRSGKHFAPIAVVNELSDLRSAFDPVAEPLLKSFFSIMLDKHDGSYDYQSYIGLDLLNLPAPRVLIENPRNPQAELARSVVLLASDIGRFELEALAGDVTWLPRRPPTRELVERRCTRLLKAMQPYLDCLGEAESLDLTAPLESMGAVSQVMANTSTKDEELRLLLSQVPVYTVHDEYMFIRILQCFETVFSWVCAEIKLAIHSLKSDIDVAIDCLRASTRFLQDAAPFFHVLSTLSSESFKEFRVYTEGASAIQSRSYKRVEAFCSKPSRARLDSVAYKSVPQVRDEILSGFSTLDDAQSEAQASGRFDTVGLTALRIAMDSFGTVLTRWRQSHYGIAVRMLGEATGTGYTEGTPYLNEVRNLPVFKGTGE